MSLVGGSSSRHWNLVQVINFQLAPTIQHNNCHVGTCVVPIILNNFEVLKNEKRKNFARLSGSRLGETSHSPLKIKIYFPKLWRLSFEEIRLSNSKK